MANSRTMHVVFLQDGRFRGFRFHDGSVGSEAVSAILQPQGIRRSTRRKACARVAYRYCILDRFLNGVSLFVYPLYLRGKTGSFRALRRCVFFAKSKSNVFVFDG